MTPKQREEAIGEARQKISQLHTSRKLKVEHSERLMKDMEKASADIAEFDEKIAVQQALIVLIETTATWSCRFVEP